MLGPVAFDASWPGYPISVTPGRFRHHRRHPHRVRRLRPPRNTHPGPRPLGVDRRQRHFRRLQGVTTEGVAAPPDHRSRTTAAPQPAADGGLSPFEAPRRLISHLWLRRVDRPPCCLQCVEATREKLPVPDRFERGRCSGQTLEDEEDLGPEEPGQPSCFRAVGQDQAQSVRMGRRGPCGTGG